MINVVLYLVQRMENIHTNIPLVGLQYERCEHNSQGYESLKQRGKHSYALCGCVLLV